MAYLAEVTGAGGSGTESRAARIARLQEEARALALEQVEALETALHEVGQVCAEIVAGGEAYPPGVRELARRLAEDAPWSAQTLGALRGRGSPLAPCEAAA